MPNSLGPWEPDAEHPGTEVRRTRVGTRVLSLGPEGMPDSQCWAWMVLPAMRLPLRQGVNLGSDLDKEVARAAADAAAFAYGYDPKGIISEAPTIASKIVNLPLADAARMAQEVGVQFRIGRQDGRVYGLSDDLWFNRVTVTVMDGIVTEARIG